MKRQTNCPNCGAVIKGDICEYCGTRFIDMATISADEPCILRFRVGEDVLQIKGYVGNASITQECFGGDFGRDINGMVRLTPSRTKRRVTLEILEY